MIHQNSPGVENKGQYYLLRCWIVLKITKDIHVRIHILNRILDFGLTQVNES